MLNIIWKWIAIFLSIILIVLIPHTYYLNNKNTQLQSEIDAYNLTIDIAAKEMQDKANELPKVVKQIEYRTQQKIQVVKEYVYDNNQTESENAIAVLRSTGF